MKHHFVAEVVFFLKDKTKSETPVTRELQFEGKPDLDEISSLRLAHLWWFKKNVNSALQLQPINEIRDCAEHFGSADTITSK